MRRGSVSSWEPWARRNSANMAQIAGSRSEFTTSDLGLNDIEYKRNGGCFLSHKKTAAIVVMFIVGVVTAGLIGAYLGPWTRKRALTALALSEEDDINTQATSSKFFMSPSIQPDLYTIEITPVIEQVVKRVRGHVVVHFNNNETQPVSQLVLNAKNITVSKVKLVSLDPHPRSNEQIIRVRRDLTVEVDNNSSIIASTDPSNETDIVMNLPDTPVNDSSSVTPSFTVTPLITVTPLTTVAENDSTSIPDYFANETNFVADNSSSTDSGLIEGGANFTTISDDDATINATSYETDYGTVHNTVDGTVHETVNGTAHDTVNGTVNATESDQTRNISSELATESDQTRNVSSELATESDHTRNVSSEHAAESDHTRNVSSGHATESYHPRNVSSELAIESDHTRNISSELATESDQTRNVSSELATESDQTRNVSSELATESDQTRNISSELATESDQTRNISSELATSTTTKAPGIMKQNVHDISPIWRQQEFPSVPISTSTEMTDQDNEIAIDHDEIDTAGGFYVVHLGSPLQRGEYALEITYEAIADGYSIFSDIYDGDGQKRWLLATNVKQSGTAGLFPTFGDYDSKAKYELVITRPKNMTTLANMPLRSSAAISDEWITDHFLQTPPSSSRNLAFVLSDLQAIATTGIEEGQTPLTLWGRGDKIGELDFIFKKIVDVIEKLRDFFAVKFPMPKLDIVALPGLIEDGIATTSLIFVSESLFYVTDESPVIVRKRALGNLINLIGEQWLGGLVSIDSYEDSWLLEGSLIYLQYLLSSKIDPTYDSLDSFGIVQQKALEIDGYDVSRTLKLMASSASFDSSISKNIYQKGACLIRMLHYLVSDNGFRNGYNKFLSGWGNSTANVSAFWEVMSNDGQWLPDGASLAQVMSSWSTQGGFPLVTISRNYESGAAVVRQEQFAYDNTSRTNDQTWYIPLTYIFEGDDWSSPKKLWMNREKEVALASFGKPDEKTWVLFNAERVGYYRVNYDENNWKLLSAALNSTVEKFPVATRTALVDDALSLAWAERLEYSTAFNLICYLREKETHHAPWFVALRNMIKLNNVLRNTGAYSSFQRFMVKFITPLYEKIVSTESGTQLHFVAVQWACLVDHPECRSYLSNLSSVPSYLETSRDCMTAKFGGTTEWDSFVDKASKSAVKNEKLKILSILPCFREEWMLQSLLDDILQGDKYDSAESLVLIRGFENNPSAARTMFNFVRRNWEQITLRFEKSYPILRAFIVASGKGIMDNQDLKDFQTFKEEQYEHLKSLGHTINVAEAEAKSRRNWLKRNLFSVKKWFDSYE